ncbi:MAG: HD domain-containing protein [Planctomycetota bacterium]|nr:HD domain-containing protein [Planctomycetota bacterium]
MAEEASTSPPKVVAAIDVGSSGIRLEIAEILHGGDIRPLESLHRSILLGNDTFDTGRLSQESIQAACEALRHYKKVMEELGVTSYRAAATNAVREAENCDTFIDRVYMSVGLNLELIDGAEQSRLTYSAVQKSLGDEIDFENNIVALVEVGGGAVDVMLMDKGEAVYADTFALGAIRIRHAMRSSKGSVREKNSFLRHMVHTYARNIPWTSPLDRAQTLIALGGDVRVLAGQLSPEKAQDRLCTLDRDAFLLACRSTADEDIDSLAQRYSLNSSDAATLGPALLIYQEIVQATNVDQIHVANASVRDGLLIDLVNEEQGKGKEEYARQIVASAVGLARKYRVDEKHAMHVAYLATTIFDELTDAHGLGPWERLLLEVAAIVHEVGSYVHNRSHHKHSMYLISASEIFGLVQEEIEVVANVARYHRRSTPQTTHPQYMALERAERMTVCKLGAILRVVDALDKAHVRKVRNPRIVVHGEELRIFVPRTLDTRLEQLYLEEKGDLMQEIYGLKPLLLPSGT